MHQKGADNAEGLKLKPSLRSLRLCDSIYNYLK